MHLSVGQVFALIIMVVMVGSILGIGLGVTGNNANSSPPPSAPQQQATTVTYTADGVNGSVVQLFPTAVLVGVTSADSVSPLVAELRKVAGVIDVQNAQFLQPTNGQQANFRAELRFLSTDKMRGVEAKIAGINSFSAVQLFPQALVSVPSQVTLRNSSLDIDQNYSFPNNTVPAFVSSDTLPGDKVTISVTADLQGQTLSNLNAVMQENLETAEQLYFVSDHYKISSFSSLYSLSSKAPRSKQQELMQAGAMVKSLLDANATEKVEPATTETRLYFSNPETVFPQDVNTFLSTYRGLDSFRLALDSNYVGISLSPDADANYADFTKGIVTQLDSLGFKVASIREPTYSLGSTISYNGGNAALVSALADISKSTDLNITALREASFDANSIVVPDQNLDFSVLQGFFRAYVKLGHSVGDDVNLDLAFVASRRSGASEVHGSESGIAAVPKQ